MDDRGRLAQSLNRNPARIVFRAADAVTMSFVRVQRLARRVLLPICELNPPRGIGAVAAGALLAASAVYGTVRGGHAEVLAEQMKSTCDYLANTAGMKVASIAMSGETQIRRDDALSLMGVGSQSSLFCLDATAARNNLKTNPWVADATVLKLYPGRLQIEIKERSAVALWQNAGAVNVIAADGTVLEPFTGERFSDLPLVVGAGAQKEARDFLTLVGAFPLLRDSVEASIFVAGRRWNLRLKNGIDVRLPEDDVENALQTLVRLDRDKKLLSRDITVVDLRLPDRVTVRLSDGAAQAREDALKELQRKDKAKKKGTET